MLFISEWRYAIENGAIWEDKGRISNDEDKNGG